MATDERAVTAAVVANGIPRLMFDPSTGRRDKGLQDKGVLGGTLCPPYTLRRAWGCRITQLPICSDFPWVRWHRKVLRAAKSHKRSACAGGGSPLSHTVATFFRLMLFFGRFYHGENMKINIINMRTWSQAFFSPPPLPGIPAPLPPGVNPSCPTFHRGRGMGSTVRIRYLAAAAGPRTAANHSLPTHPSGPPGVAGVARPMGGWCTDAVCATQHTTAAAPPQASF